jgi:hypothetical protein
MSKKTAHEPEARIMSAEDVWNDAQRLNDVLRQNLLKSEPVVHLNVPLSFFLSALDTLDRDELIVLDNHIKQRLAI